MPASFNRVVLAVAITAGLSAMTSADAQANIGQTYGFGPRTAALAGAGAAWDYGAFAAYSNPAGLPFTPAEGDKRLLLEVGFISMTPSFIDINDVITQNSVTSNQVSSGSVDTDYRSTQGWELGLVYRLLPETANLTLGLTAYLPLEQIAYMDTGESFQPEYILYRARTQRPQVEIGLGADVTPHLHVGAGLHLAYALTTSATVFIQTNAADASTMRFSASLKPKLSPQFAVLYTSDDAEMPVQGKPASDPRYTLGLVLRLPVTSDNSMNLQSGVNAFGTNSYLAFNFNAESALFYDPLTVEMGGSYKETPRTRSVVQLDYEHWSSFEAPALSFGQPNNLSCGSPCGVQLSGTQNPAFPYRDILVPRIGQEFYLGRVTLRAGYAYQPGIMGAGLLGSAATPNGVGNYLDPDKHIFTLGAGYHFSHFLHFDVPCDVDANLAYQALVTQHIVKEDSQDIGAPGYDAGGKIYGGGISLSLAF